MGKEVKKDKMKESSIDVSLDEIIEKKKSENSALKKIMDSLQKEKPQNNKE